MRSAGYTGNLSAMAQGQDQQDSSPKAKAFEEPELPVVEATARVANESRAAPDPVEGDAVGPYILSTQLGRGGAGTVFKAEHTETKRIVALKVLAASKVRRARIVQRFFDEVRAASLVQHPGLVEVYDFIEEERPRRLAYAMEFVDGRSLRRQLREERALDLRTAIAVGQQICEALSALHGAGIIHRDLKPENIMLVGDRDQPTVKLLDFGVVKFLPVDKTEAQEPSVAVGTFVGTPRYMAPEQAAGAGIDHRADLFALGVMLFEMISGRCPHEGDSLRDVVLAKLKGAPRITVNPEQEILPQELTEVVDACLKLKPHLRPASADAVHAALTEAKVVLSAVGRPVRRGAASPPDPEILTQDLQLAPVMPSAADTMPMITIEKPMVPAELSSSTPKPVQVPIIAPPSDQGAFGRRLVLFTFVVVAAVVLAVGARIMTDEDAVLVLPEPDPAT
ncbi:MAG: serine/threonine-protein kinase, partial [Myxococcota bacterium]